MDLLLAGVPGTGEIVLLYKGPQVNAVPYLRGQQTHGTACVRIALCLAAVSPDAA